MVDLFLPDFYFNARMNQAFVNLKYGLLEEKTEDSKEEENTDKPVEFVTEEKKEPERPTFTPHPEWFRDDCNIKGVYGVFPISVWNGEVYCVGRAANDNADATTKWFNDRGVSVVAEYTNTKLQPFHIYDNGCNIYTKKMEKEDNYCCVASDLLLDYIGEVYPKFKFISSSAKNIWELKDLQKELNRDEFSYVIANTVFNPDDSIFELENKEKIILVANSTHKYSCPHDNVRCDYMSELQLNYGKQPENANSIPCTQCSAVTDDFYTVKRDRKHFITVEDMYGKYPENGINTFYIYGRGYNAFDVLEAYIYYMIKPEYQDQCRLRMMIDLQ
jgi:hypothetical protein